MRWFIMMMNRFVFIALVFVLPLHAFAAWQVSSPKAVAPQDPFFQAGTPASPRHRAPMPSSYSIRAFPNQFANLGSPAPVYAISICGSLKENIERIMNRYHWRVVWKAPFDYNFDGRVAGGSLPNVIDKLLRPFPLKAVMYMSNRTLSLC